MQGICLIEPLFHRTLEGRKTETRRIIPINFEPADFEKKANGSILAISPDPLLKSLRSRYKIGEILFLKEPYYKWDDWDPHDGQYSYKFKNPDKIVPYWENKRYMPLSAARHFIKCTALRPERLQDISDDDCMKEGIVRFGVENECGEYEFYGVPELKIQKSTPREAYASLIDSINGEGTWDRNPWVWVITYEQTTV